MRDRTTRPARVSMRPWLEFVLRRLGLWYREVDSRVEAPAALAPAALSSTGR